MQPAHHGAHRDAERLGRVEVAPVLQEACRIYGLLALTFGIGLVWLARWPGWGARRRAIEDYVWNLSQELSRHFGSRKYRSEEHTSELQSLRHLVCRLLL